MSDPVRDIIIAINIEELIHVLQQKGLAKGYGYPISLPIPPSTTLSLDFPITSGYMGAPIEIRIAPDPDHVLQLKIYKDGELYYQDNDVVAGVYNNPIRYLKDYNLLRFAMSKFTIEVTNTLTTDTAYFNAIFVWAEVRRDIWYSVVEKYYSTVARVFEFRGD